MLNAADVPSADLLRVIDYADPQVAEKMAAGKMNTGEAQILAHIASSIRRGHTQWRPGPLRPERVCLVGSGPSLSATVEELRALVWAGAALVTVNGAYRWCIDQGLRPTTQILMDARPTNARFLEPVVPKCNYVLASQCAPPVWDVVEGRPHVWIFHAVVKQEGATSDLLDAYYAGQWVGVGGGTTVATRAINLLRIAGYLRFDLFGVDCCWSGSTHHAFDQPENAHDAAVTVYAGVRDHPETMRPFRVSAWMLKQCEDLLTIMRVNGEYFALAAHGDGMFAYLLRLLGDADVDALTLTRADT